MTKHEAKAGQNSFEDYMNKSPRGKVQFMPGQMIESQIVAISNDTIFLELNGKSEGVLDRAELLDKNGELTVKEGDTIKAFFLNAQNGELRFTTRISSDKVDTAILEEAYKNKIPVEGLVEKEIKGGYEVKIGEVRAFCPYSQMTDRKSYPPPPRIYPRFRRRADNLPTNCPPPQPLCFTYAPASEACLFNGQLPNLLYMIRLGYA